VSQTFSGAANGGTVTFSEPVEFTGGGVPTAWTRGTGGSRRNGSAVSLLSPTVVSVTVASPLPFALAAGWHYNAGVGDLRTVSSGLPVASFGPFL